jgi:hypothetical protein
VGSLSEDEIDDLEQLLAFLNQLHDVLWGMYYNGEPPTLRPSPHSVRELVAEKLEDWRESSNQGYIVAETRRCMALLTRAANSLSLSERLSRSWV